MAGYVVEEVAGGGSDDGRPEMQHSLENTLWRSPAVGGSFWKSQLEGSEFTWKSKIGNLGFFSIFLIVFIKL